MIVDHFLIPRVFGISRPLLHVPRWSETAMINWPAVIALLAAVAFGSYASGLLPGEDPSRFWGLPPVEAWAIAGVLYIVGVAIARAWAAEPRNVLGFSRLALNEPAPPGAVVDMASREEAMSARVGGPPKAEPVGGI